LVALEIVEIEAMSASGSAAPNLRRPDQIECSGLVEPYEERWAGKQCLPDVSLQSCALEGRLMTQLGAHEDAVADLISERARNVGAR
jgi:hypothetical protein